MAVPGSAQPKRDCFPLKDPKKLPAVDQVVDSAALATWAAAAAVADTVGLRYQSSPHQILPILVSGDSTALVAVAKAIRVPGPKELVAVRVVITPGPKPTLALARSVFCPAEPTDGRLQVVFGRVEVDRASSASAGPPRPPDFRLVISDKGALEKVEVMGGDPSFQQMIEDHYRSLHFYPAAPGRKGGRLDGRHQEGRATALSRCICLHQGVLAPPVRPG
jgi:hypothetical protein